MGSAGPPSATPWGGSSARRAPRSTREYYFNDHGAQIDRFARSLLASARGRAVPEDGYGGSYIHEIATAVLEKRPDAADLPDDEAQEVFRELGVDMMFAEIKQSLRDFGVDFDVYFHEDHLHQSGAVAARRRPAHRPRQHLREGRRALAGHRAVR